MSGKINRHSTQMIPDDLAADLPAPRDDEPESLRRDIVDELADHLQCALHRELLASGTQPASGRRQPADFPNANEHEQTAWQQVLTRFGSPSTIARQLWLDAMKERIMAQKTMAAALVLAAVALCVMTAMTWSRSREDRRFLLETFESNRDMMQQMSRLQEQILQDSRASQEALRSIAATDVSNPEWVRAEVLVKLDSLDGPPAEVVEVKISPTPYTADSVMGAKALTDADGRADLGQLHIGRYQLSITSPSGEQMWKQVSIYPGKPFSEVIVMPSGPNLPVDVTVRVEWPDEFDPEDTWVVLWKDGLIRAVAGETWSAPYDAESAGFQDGPGDETRLNPVFVISPDGTVFEVTNGQRNGRSSSNSSITWSPDDAREITNLRLPDRSYRFHQISFVVDAATLPVLDWVSNGLPTRTFVPDSYLNNGPKYQEVSEGPDPVLTINVPDSTADAIADFREEIRKIGTDATPDETST